MTDDMMIFCTLIEKTPVQASRLRDSGRGCTLLVEISSVRTADLFRVKEKA
jgi:hypothetical protein